MPAERPPIDARPDAQRLIDEIAMAGDIHGAVRLQRIADQLARWAAIKGFGAGVAVASFFWWVFL